MKHYEGTERAREDKDVHPLEIIDKISEKID